MKNCWKILGFVLIAAIPIFLVFRYEEFYLAIDSPEQIQESIRQANIKLNELARQNVESFDWFKEKLKEQTKDSHHIQEKVISQTQEKMQRQTQASQGYQQINIINVQLTQGFAHEKATIKQEIMMQLQWYNQQFGMDLQIVEWEVGMTLNGSEPQVIVLFSELRYQQMEQNIALKLKKGEYRSQYYLEQIVNELNKLPSFSHCKFTNKSCKQSSLIFINHDQPKINSFWSVENMHFLDQNDQQLIFNAIASILQMESYISLTEEVSLASAKELYSIVMSRTMVQQCLKTIAYISFIMRESDFDHELLIAKVKQNPDEAIRYLKNGEFLTPYIHPKQEIQLLAKYFKGLEDAIPSKRIVAQGLLEDNRVGVIDTFPNDFKIGVYLPLLVIFLYPWILKAKEALLFLFSLLKRQG